MYLYFRDLIKNDLKKDIFKLRKSLSIPQESRNSNFERYVSDLTHLSLGVAEDDSLSDGQSVIQIAQCIKLPLLSLNSNEELLDTVQCQFITVEWQLTNCRYFVFKKQNSQKARIQKDQKSSVYENMT